jgi:hypothetical protein
MPHKVEYLVENYPTFRMNISPPFSGSKNKPGKKSGWKQGANRTSLIFKLFFFLCILFVGPEYGDNKFLRNTD